MKIVHIITDLDVGGAEIMLARLVEQLQRRHVQNVVVSLIAPGAIAARIERAGVPVHSLGMRRGSVDPLALWRLVRLLRRTRPDVVHTWLYHADLAGTVAGALAGAADVVWNIRCGELEPGDRSGSLAKVLAWLSRRPSAIISNSLAGREAHEALGYRPKQWCIIPNGLDAEEFRPRASARGGLRAELGLPRDARLVGRLARFHPMKDYPAFIEAAALVAPGQPDVHFVAAGRGVPAAPIISRMVERCGLTGRMHLLPERSDVPDFLAALDVLVSSSSSGEGFPNIISEAMACGVPCVVTDVGDSAHIVGDAGVVVPPRDSTQLARGIQQILGLGDTSRTALGAAARERITSQFSLERVATAYHQLFVQLAGDRPAGRE